MSWRLTSRLVVVWMIMIPVCCRVAVVTLGSVVILYIVTRLRWLALIEVFLVEGSDSIRSLFRVFTGVVRGQWPRAHGAESARIVTEILLVLLIVLVFWVFLTLLIIVRSISIVVIVVVICVAILAMIVIIDGPFLRVGFLMIEIC
jgi:hypothetical protein